MRAIITKYLGPTATKGARISARLDDGRTLSVPYDSALSDWENHAVAAHALACKLGQKGFGWCGNWSGAHCANDSMAWINVSVQPMFAFKVEVDV